MFHTRLLYITAWIMHCATWGSPIPVHSKVSVNPLKLWNAWSLFLNHQNWQKIKSATLARIWNNEILSHCLLKCKSVQPLWRTVCHYLGWGMAGLGEEWERVLTSDEHRNEQIFKIKYEMTLMAINFSRCTEKPGSNSQESRLRHVKKTIRMDGVKVQKGTSEVKLK